MSAPSFVGVALRSLRIPRSRVVFAIACWIVVLMVAAAIFAPLVAPYDPDYVDLSNVLSGSTFSHWLGTDGLGRDTLSRMIYGARTSLLAPLLVVIFSTILGILLGLVAAWRGGWIDALLSRVFDLIFAFPALLLAILAVALFGKGLVGPVVAMSIAYTPFVARLIRSLVENERLRSYVSAYRVQGFSGPGIAFRRVLPNVMPTVGAQSTLNFGYVVADLAALSFLGLGVQPPTADWGAMINQSRGALLSGQIMPALVPSLAVVIVVIAVNIIGEELSDRIGGQLPS